MSRRNFTPKTKALIRERSGGVCEVHRIPDEMRRVRYRLLPMTCKRAAEEVDHVQCDWAEGDPTPDNGADLCKPCHAIKTRIDKKESAKAARRRGETGQQARRSRAKAAGKHKSIAGKGFDRTWTKRMDGTTIKRETKP
jgi:hypothetical protein